MEKNDQIQICKVIAQAIMADAKITDEEHEFLTKLMDRYELDDAERKDVMNRNVDDDPVAMVKEEIGGLESKDELLGELLSAITADGKIAPQEKTLLETVGKSIGMSPEELAMVLED
ncbi:MAG: TerB family tellurite resistance protein [Deltaproteobacteria bacterium]|nr:TerB family tellurite resistance protein [Deltaproteobacteria bacterium]